MTRKHYDSPKLTRYERRKLIRRSFGYRLRRWSRRVSRRLDTISGFVRMWALLTLGAYFYVAIGAGPGSGLLPSPVDEILCGIAGVGVIAWQVWSTFSKHKKEDEERLRKQEREAGARR